MTIGQLLAHTSGLVDAAHFGALNVVPERDVPQVRSPVLRAQAVQALADARAGRPVIVSPAVQVAVATTRPLAFVPGSRFAYSNTDYLVLTMLVEKVTGQPLAQVFQLRIFARLGLQHTFLARRTAFPGPHMHSYAMSNDGQLVDASDDLANGPSGSGTVVSTAADLTVFYRALLRGELLAPTQLRQMMTVTPNSSADGVFAGYGLGLEQYRTPCGTAWGHGGSIGGYLTGVYATPDGDTVAVYAQNSPRGTVREQVLRDLVCTQPNR